MNDNGSGGSYIGLTATIVSAYVSNNSVTASDMPGLINQIHSALIRVSGGHGDVQPEQRTTPFPKGATGWHSIVVLVE